MILKNAFIATLPSGNQVAYGDIFGDEKKRFSDGANIRTSCIGSIFKDAETGKRYIQTMNSTYEIEYADGVEIPDEHKEGKA